MGSQAIASSLKAGAIGLAIVMVFMIVMYAVPGIAASLALAIYTDFSDRNLIFIRYYTDASGYRRYYPWYRYGGGCERYHICTYP